jgi:hypothetical protein
LKLEAEPGNDTEALNQRSKSEERADTSPISRPNKPKKEERERERERIERRG